MKGALFLKNENRIRHPCGIFDNIDETNRLQLIDFRFYNFTFGRMDIPTILVDRDRIRPSVSVMFKNVRIKFRNFIIRPGE